MCIPRPSRVAPVLVVAVLLAAAPAFAAPSAAAPPSPGALQLVTDWWTGLTSPLVGLFAPARVEMDPDGAAELADPDGGTVTFTATDEPGDDTENRATVDPNG